MADLMGDVVAGRDIVLKSSGEAIRAFLYVTDAVVGMFTVLFHGGTAKAYNLANETEPASIKELAQLLSSFSEEITTEVAISSENNKGYCNYKRVALDTSEIEKLGWKPMVSLEEGVKRTYLCSIINKV
jgi:nucleoside-diphosphate-sugar epimerase